MKQLTVAQLDLIIESLGYTLRAFREYNYESYEFKQKQIAEVQDVIAIVREKRKGLNHANQN